MKIWKEYNECCKTLGVSFDDSRSEKTLKKQYRALALEHHPDKGGDEEKFIKINASYEFISKYSESILDHKPIENRKEKYQNGGFVWPTGNEVDESMDDIIKRYWTQYGDYIRHREQRNSKANRWASNRTLKMQLNVKELFNGIEHLYTWDRKKACICGGDTNVICYRCNGKGYEEETHMSTLEVSSIRMNNEGDIIWGGMGDVTSNKAFDLILEVELTDTDEFDLKYYVNKPPDVLISKRINTSSLGEEVVIKSLEGEIKVKIPPNCIDGAYLRVKNRGLVFNREGKRFRSDLLVKINLYK